MFKSEQKLNKKRVAVIGSGISGLSAAWLLRNDANVTLFESQERFGGHSNTVVVQEADREVAIDTGFMVFNRPNYPLLSRLFDELGVETYDTDMSFSVSLDRGRLEYAGSNLNTLFAQRRNLLRPSFLKMIRDILRFNRTAKELLQGPQTGAGTLQQFLDKHALGERFREDYLYPMAAAIWSCPRDAVADFPALSFARFFDNHGLINLQDRPQWQTLRGGASAYVDKLVKDLGDCAKRSRPVRAVLRQQRQVAVVLDGNQVEMFDEVVFACHSDQALRLFKNASPTEATMLRAVPYQPNRVLLHTDPRLMPQRSGVWSSWNYLGGQNVQGDQAVSVTYWMNSLQALDTSKNYFVSLNPLTEPAPSTVVAEFEYEHPMFDAHSLQLSQQLASVQGREHVWFAGAWTGYGFHEDGMRSGVDVAQRLGARLPWVEQLQDSHALRVRTPAEQVKAA